MHVEAGAMMQKRFRNAVKHNIRRDCKDDADTQRGVEKMREAIFAVLYHSCDINPAERWQLVPVSM